MKQAAIFAASVALFAGGVQADTNQFSGEAAFIFDGVQTKIAPASPQASRYAGYFASLAPSCDPYCIAPAITAEGVATVTEADVLEFLLKGVARNEGLLVDARAPQHRKQGFIPGSVNLPHQTLAPANEFRDDILKALGAREFDGLFNFVDAQDVLVFDDGPTQSDAGKLIGHLIAAGYPAQKIRYYRGGMQVWSVLGLTIQE